MSTRRWFALGIVCAVAWGCNEPPQVVSTAPPGMEPPKVAPITDGQGSQALGETMLRKGAEVPKPVVSALPPSPPTAKGETKTTKSGLVYETLKEGTGPEVKAGQSVTVHYTGTLANGKVFDSSREKGAPATFKIGVQQVIPGWDEGVPGMKVGERRTLTVPSALSYGAIGQPPLIPPHATLTFDIEVLSAE